MRLARGAQVVAKATSETHFAKVYSQLCQRLAADGQLPSWMVQGANSEPEQARLAIVLKHFYRVVFYLLQLLSEHRCFNSVAFPNTHV